MTARRSLVSLAVLAVVAMACGPGGAGTGEPSGTIRLYTSVTEETVQAVLAAYAEQHPEVAVELFRAPTGELNARIAGERRQGAIQGDVLWLTDPLSMQQYASEGLLRTWTPREASAIPPRFRHETFWGTRILNLIIVHQVELEPAPGAWQDLTDPAYRNGLALPDPGFAGSAFGALGYFALSEDFGFDFYRDLEENGAVQVQAPGEVTTGVAEGRFLAGMTLSFSARTAQEKGSPIELVWPEPGAIAIYSPIAVFQSTYDASAAESFAGFVLTREAQQAIAETGWQPVREDVEWPHGGPQVSVDWEVAFDRQQELLEQYRSIFGG